jgi:hypothetical protein
VAIEPGRAELIDHGARATTEIEHPAAWRRVAAELAQDVQEEPGFLVMSRFLALGTAARIGSLVARSLRV